MKVLIVAAAAALALAASPAAAAPTSYQISFWCPGEGTPISDGSCANPPTAGSFTYDPDTLQFADFHVTWMDRDYDLTGSANAPTVTPMSDWKPECTAPNGGATFLFLQQSGCGYSNTNLFVWRGDKAGFMMGHVLFDLMVGLRQNVVTVLRIQADLDRSGEADVPQDPNTWARYEGYFSISPTP